MTSGHLRFLSRLRASASSISSPFLRVASSCSSTLVSRVRSRRTCVFCVCTGRGCERECEGRCEERCDKNV